MKRSIAIILLTVMATSATAEETTWYQDIWSGTKKAANNTVELTVDTASSAWNGVENTATGAWDYVFPEEEAPVDAHNCPSLNQGADI